MILSFMYGHIQITLENLFVNTRIVFFRGNPFFVPPGRRLGCLMSRISSPHHHPSLHKSHQVRRDSVNIPSSAIFTSSASDESPKGLSSEEEGDETQAPVCGVATLLGLHLAQVCYHTASGVILHNTTGKATKADEYGGVVCNPSTKKSEARGWHSPAAS